MIKKSIRRIHPGEYLREELMKANGLTITEIATLLHVSRQTVSAIVNERADITPEMALRIATVFGGTADIWIRLQTGYDLEKAEKKVKQLKLTPYQPRRTA